MPGIDWYWQLLADAGWTAVVLYVRPARLARVLVGREKSLTPEAIEQTQELLAADTDQAVPQHPMAAYWAQHVAIEGGAAPNTVLEQIERTGEESMTAVIRSTLPGKPVPKIDLLELSAAINWPEDDIAITPRAQAGRRGPAADRRPGPPRRPWTSTRPGRSSSPPRACPPPSSPRSAPSTSPMRRPRNSPHEQDL
ncbi:hypothetical protein LT493_26115 [Streptomyces tricolor]|nr:hypothetical protein [Streptomyces tricolor]